jgi:DNA repair exonuclease SbcCD ATPase subunit
MDITAILTAFGVIISGMAGFSGLIIALTERRRKRVDVVDKMMQMAYSLILPLKAEIADLQKNLAEVKAEAKREIALLHNTIAGMQQMLAEKDVMVVERDKVIVHMQGEINLLTAKIVRLEKRTGELRKPQNGV